MLPRSSQLDAKIARESPTCGQDHPQYFPRASNQTSPEPKILKKRWTSVRSSTFAVFLNFAPKNTKNAQDISPNGLKLAILALAWPILAPSWPQLGAVLAHLGEILVDPSPAKITQNQSRQLLVDFSSQGRPQELPDPLQTSIFQDLGTIFCTFFYIDFSKCIFIDSSRAEVG